MAYTLVKSKDETFSSSSTNAMCPRCGSEFRNTYIEGNLAKEIKNYPSCYHYNVIVMLAKRLVKEEQVREENLNHWINRRHLDKKLARRIIDA